MEQVKLNLNRCNSLNYKVNNKPAIAFGSSSNENNSVSRKDKALKILSQAASAVGLAGLSLTLNPQFSAETLENFKNENEILEKFRKRYKVYNEGLGREDAISLNLNRHNKYRKGLILECMKREDAPIALITQLQGFYPAILSIENFDKFDYHQVTNLIQNHKDFPLEYVFAALRTCNIEGHKSEKVYNKFKSSLNFDGDKFRTYCNVKKQMLENPDLYLNGDYESENLSKEVLFNFIYRNCGDLLNFIDLFDKQTLDVLLRKRIATVADYANMLEKFDGPSEDLLKKAIACKNIDGTEIPSNLKIELIDILNNFRQTSLSFIKKFIKDDKLDIEGMKIDLFHDILLEAGISRSEVENMSKEKILEWNPEQSYKLITTGHCFSEILKIANQHDFKTYIQDIDNKHGKVNALTRETFVTENLDYDKWVNANSLFSTEFLTKNKSKEDLAFIAEIITDEVNKLKATPAVSNLLNKRFPENIRENKFFIPKEIYSHKNRFYDFVKNLNVQLGDVWKRAEMNYNNGNNSKALSTLTIRDHILSQLDAINNVSSTENNQNINWSIKMWDRNPQKDLFQGNYSNCCIGIGGINQKYMNDYLLNTAFNMIEVVDKKTNKTIGNALCYFVKDDDGVAFVIDSFELSGSNFLSRDNSVLFRDKLIEFAKKLTTEICGKSDMPIYMGVNYNKIPTNDLQEKPKNFKLVGNLSHSKSAFTANSEIYLDLFHDGSSSPILKKSLLQGVETQAFRLA